MYGVLEAKRKKYVTEGGANRAELCPIMMIAKDCSLNLVNVGDLDNISFTGVARARNWWEPISKSMQIAYSFEEFFCQEK